MRIFFILITVMMAQPEFPNKFTQKFHETFSYFLLKRETEGTYYYNYDLKKYRIDRENG